MCFDCMNLNTVQCNLRCKIAIVIGITDQREKQKRNISTIKSKLPPKTKVICLQDSQDLSFVGFRAEGKTSKWSSQLKWPGWTIQGAGHCVIVSFLRSIVKFHIWLDHATSLKFKKYRYESNKIGKDSSGKNSTSIREGYDWCWILYK